MSKGRGSASSTDHLVARAGDVSWQLDDDRPPACRVPRQGLSSIEQQRLHRLFDVAGPGKVTEAQWVRVRAAIAVCSACPVLTECYVYALDPAHRVEGVWGGHYFAATDPAAAARGYRTAMRPPPPKYPRGRRSPAA